MRRRDLVVLGISALLALGGCSRTDDARPVAPGPVDVVSIEATGCARPQPRLGVGTVVAEGLVLAAAHVVEGDLRDLRVDGSPAAVVGLDVETDLALLAVVGPLDASPSWIVEPTDDVGPGPVRVVTPDGAIETELNRTLVLRVEDLSADTTSQRAALELDIVVEPGDSGSPVIDAAGSLIGVVVLSRAPTGVSYASRIPGLADLLDTAAYQAVRDASEVVDTEGSLAPRVACT